MDRQALRECFGRWTTGVALATTLGAAREPHGLTINSFSSVSLEPPLIAWCIDRRARSYEAFCLGNEFVVQVLSSAQETLARHFAGKGVNKFAGLPSEATAKGTPVFRDALATIICERWAVHDGGDHTIIVGRVTHSEIRNGKPLLFSSGKFCHVGAPIGNAAGKRKSAAILVVGDELLSGSTRDETGMLIASRLKQLGLLVTEMRIVPDDVAAIASAVRCLKQEHQWLLVSGGLGPTHDDVTASGIAAALDLPVTTNEEARQILAAHHSPSEIPAGRLPAICLPQGCRVLPDLISGAAGFKVDNVIALPGMPVIVASLLDTLEPILCDGPPICESSLKICLLESDITATLNAAQQRHPAVRIGSYPYFGSRDMGVNIVLRSSNEAALAACKSDLEDALRTVVRTSFSPLLA